MESHICLDTDFLIDFLRSKPDAVKWVNDHERNHVLSTTIINLFELYYGAYKSSSKNLRSVEQLSQRLLILNLSHESVKRAGEIKASLETIGQTLDFRDVLIGAVAALNGYAIKTRNVKDFSKTKELVLV